VTDTRVRTVRSFCRICTAVCGILVDVDSEQVLRVRGDDENPFSHGYTCAKGRSLPTMHHHPERIEHPMVRVDGELRATTWEACLDDLGTRLRTIIDESGPSAVGVFFGSGVGMDAAGYRMAQSLLRAIGTLAKFSPLTIDGTAKALVADLVGGATAMSGRPDYEHATFVVILGSNPVVSHGHTVAMPDPVSLVRDLTRRGEVWIVDPRRTETSRLATHHLAPRPGTDYALLAYLVRELLRHAEPSVLARANGIEQLAAAVDRFTLEHAARLADVPTAQLELLLDGIRRAETVTVDTGTGVTMAASGNVTVWLAWAVMVLTDSMNRPGGYWFHPGYSNQFEAVELPVSPPEGSFGPGPRSRPDTHAFLGEWPCAVLADEIRAGNIRAVLNLGGHLVTAFPDVNDLEPALRELEVFATIEIIANETTALSTHVFPTKDQLERADVTLWDLLNPRVCAQHTPAVVAPVGDRRSTWWVLAEIGRRIGHDLADTTGDDATDDARLALIHRRARRPHEELVANGWVVVDHEIPAPWVDAHVERMGGWRLAPLLLVDQLAGLDVPDALVLTPRRQGKHLNSQLDYLGDHAEVVLHPSDAQDAAVADGDPVVVRSAHGELTGVARVDPFIRRGVVSVPHGHQGANVNRLTDKDALDPITGMVTYSGIPVTLHAAR
jgi:anaerobic selenocysteine-containing dehydrogenase